MKLLHSLPPYNFPGVEEPDFGKAKFVVLPVPYDGTASYGAGAKEAPHAIIKASRFMELYDHELETRPVDAGIYTLDELEPARGDAKETCRRVKEAVAQIFEHGKTPVTLGGDHSVAIGAIEAAAFKYGSLSVVAFDAHLDAWAEYEGSPYSHASVGTRIADVTPSVSLHGANEIIIGARNAGEAEIEFCNKHSVMIIDADDAAHDAKRQFRTILPHLRKNVYITFDFDVLDPSIMPAVGTPEPDGLSFAKAADWIGMIGEKRTIIGMDFCELCPIPGMSAPDFLAARLAYKTIGIAWKSGANA